MKIYFTCSTADFKTYRNNYFAIRNYLVKKEHILTRDWLMDTEQRLLKRKKELTDIKEIYKACITAIKDAELVIIEDTVSNFSTGHQITLALQMRKPTLVLWKGKKHRQFNQMFIHGIDSELLQVSEYSIDNVEKIIQTFVNTFEDISEKNRFHLVLNNIERMYLDWAQYVRGESRTKIIRDSLRKTMENDEKYREYLLNHLSKNEKNHKI